MICAALDNPDTIVLSVSGVRWTALYLMAAFVVALCVTIDLTVTGDPGPPPGGRQK